MKVLMASAEVAPYAKVGGLADVVGSLPKALNKLGVDARIVLPAYRMVEDQAENISPILCEFPVRINETWSKQAYIRSIQKDGLTTYLIGTDEWFQDADRSETIYRPGIDQYLFFSSAVLQLGKHVGWNPQIVHCHDWHTGFIPVMMKHSPFHQWNEMASVFTIHNLAYQGEFDLDILDRLGMGHWLFSPDFVEAYGRVNFLKAGAAFADLVTTVSPNYAREIQTPEYGARLEGLMQYLAKVGRLEGVLNGIDQSVFDPETDPNIPCHYNSSQPQGKALCKEELCRTAGFLPGPEPILGIVSRMSTQKGLDLLIDAADRLLKKNARLVVLGAGEPPILEGLHHVERRHPHQVKFFEGYHETLASLIYAGCDGFLMPSSFEPCGLGQMIAMRYGTIPIVRQTGGLKDTVEDCKTGFVFKEKSAVAFLKAIDRFLSLYEDKDRLNEMRKSVMNVDWSWDKSALTTVKLYQQVLAKRQSESIQIA